MPIGIDSKHCVYCLGCEVCDETGHHGLVYTRATKEVESNEGQDQRDRGQEGCFCKSEHWDGSTSYLEVALIRLLKNQPKHRKT